MNEDDSRPVLVLASRNAKKSAEMAELLAPHGIRVVSVAEYPSMHDVVEDGTTFAANAEKKAVETARTLGGWSIADDSGLAVDALAGAPGVYSARYAGEGAGDEANNDLLLSELSAVPPERRGAGYVCHLVLADPTGAVRARSEATCRGIILAERRGSHGFGYDPLFLIPEYHKTFGELAPVVKRHLSHRAKAFEQLLPQLVGLMQQE